MNRLNDAQLQKRLKKMNVPINRTFSLNKNNLQWLARNLHMKNSEHRFFQETITEVKIRLQNKEYAN